MALLYDGEPAAACDHASRRYDPPVAANLGLHSQLRCSARRLGLPGDGRGGRALPLPDRQTGITHTFVAGPAGAPEEAA
ncbi:hypothetical protein [Streptomyces sp. NPDC058773]|uniref:hypothetical protein n=1 Tax=Streptomyces sp. NPDC058773 TaxID=3346632 RepID=UPI0036876B0C